MSGGEGPAVAVEINGQPRVVPAGTLAGLLDTLGYPAQRSGVAVAVNDQVVRRSEWDRRLLSAGDRIEVVGAVQGG